MTTDTISPLPDKLSALLRVAMADLAKCEADPHYRINMSTWHQMLASGKCEVCLAGSVMAQTMGMPKEQAVQVTLRGENDRKYAALNSLRCGDVSGALHYLDGEEHKCQPLNRAVHAYEQNRRAFCRDMRKLADDLEKEGL